MSTQYNAIEAPYNEYHKASIAFIERDDVYSILSPFIKRARVLDLACGSGVYTYYFLSWGAASPVGLDISSAMLERARQDPLATTTTTTTGIRFIEQDCSKAQLIEGGGFDLVFGAWFLNYSESKEGLVEMFRLVGMNLKEKNRFVAVTYPPRDYSRLHVEAERRARPEGSQGLRCSVVHRVKDGVCVNTYAETRVGEVDFDCWHLRKDVFVDAAREAGMMQKMVWSETKVTDRQVHGGREGGASVEELESYREVPRYGILVIGN